MKTPIQKTMEWVWKQRESTNSKDAILTFDAVYQYLSNDGLEKEKEVIETAFLEGRILRPLDSEQWYNETFNTKEI